MPYIGNTIRAADDYRLIDDISSGFNGSETSFALQVAGSAPVPFPKSPQQVLISVNGVIQEPDPTGTSGFNLVGTNIVFSSAPTNGHAFFGIIYATADYLNAGGNFPSGSLGAPSITFIGDENSGLYRKGSGSVGFVSDATEIANFDSNGITISSGNLIIPEKIIHSGDTNTFLTFPSADSFRVQIGGAQRIDLDTSTTVFNDDGGSVDFRIEGDTNQHLFFVDGSADAIGFGTSSISNGKFVFNSGSANQVANFVSTDAGANINLTDNSARSTIEQNGTDLKIISDTGNADADSTIKFQVDASTKMTINSSGNVGIGTSSPESFGGTHVTLEVAGTGTTQGGVFKTATSDSAGTGTNGTEMLMFTDNSKGAINVVSADPLTLSTANTERMRIDSSGRVGLGTTSPDSRLHLSYGSGDSQIRLTRSNAAANTNDYGRLLWESQDDVLTGKIAVARESAENNGYMHFSTASGGTLTERMRITSIGRVGLGTTSPTALLEVKADDGEAADLYVGQFINLEATAGQSYGVNIQAGSNSTDHGFRVKNKANDATHLLVRGDGRVGIGTASPSAELSVSGDLHFGGNASVESGSSNGSLTLVGGSTYKGGRIVLSGGSGSNDIRFTTSGSSTTNTERMRLDGAGRVLIGTTVTTSNQSGRLNVFGTDGDSAYFSIRRGSNNASGPRFAMCKSRNTTDGAASGLVQDGDILGTIHFYANDSQGFEEGAAIQAVIDGTPGSNDVPTRLSFQTTPDGSDTKQERMRITNSGRVGISTTSPQSKLNIVDTSNNGAISQLLKLGNNSSGSGTGAGLQLGSGSGNAGNSVLLSGFYDGTGTSFSIQTCNTFNGSQSEKLRINNTGDVGIGTTAPSYKLDVVGDSGGSFSASSNSTSGTLSIVGKNSSGSVSAISRIKSEPSGSGNTSKMLFQTRNSSNTMVEAMRIDDNQVLLVGTTSTTVEGMTGTGSGVKIGGSSGRMFEVAGNAEPTSGFNRTGDDGTIIRLIGQGSVEGTISVSGSSVSYNGGHLSRWSQFKGLSTTDKSARPTIYQGTVMSNLDDLCVWEGEENQQLNMTKVSDVVGDKDVAGVFFTWDDDDDKVVNDFYVAMTGDMVIRVAASTTVARGDLLISAGDGTAKPQADDIVRSSTIAKITSTNHTATYTDGSKAYPCVLMAC